MFITNLDLFGVIPQLSIEGKSKYKSIQGLFITLIALGLTFASVSGNISNWWNRRNPTISQETRLNTGTVPIGGSNNPFYFGIRCIDFKDISGLNVSSPDLTLDNVPPFKTQQLQFSDGNGVTVPVNLDRCEDVGQVVAASSLNNYYCLTDEIELSYQNSGQNSNQYFVFLDSNYDDQLKVGDLFSTCGMMISYQTSYSNSADYNNFTQLDTQSISLNLSKTKVYAQSISVMQQVYQRKNSIFSFKGEYETVSYSTVDTITQLGAVEFEQNLFSFVKTQVPLYAAAVFQFSPKMIVYTIKYIEIEDLISIIGGTFGAFMSLLTIVSSEMNKVPYKAKLINSIFKFYRVTDEISSNQMKNIELKPKMENEKDYDKEDKKDVYKLRDSPSKSKNTRSTILGPEQVLKLKNTFSLVKNVRKEDKIYTFDIYKAMMKDNLCMTLDNKEKNFKKIDSYIRDSLEIKNILKTPYIFTQISKLLMGNDMAKFLQMEDINIYDNEFNQLDEVSNVLFKNSVDYKDEHLLEKLEEEDNSPQERVKDYIFFKLSNANKL